MSLSSFLWCVKLRFLVVGCPAGLVSLPFHLHLAFLFSLFSTAWIWKMRMRMMIRYVPRRAFCLVATPQLTCEEQTRFILSFLCWQRYLSVIYCCVLLSSLLSSKSSDAVWFLTNQPVLVFFFFFLSTCAHQKTFRPNEDLSNLFPLVTTYSYVNRGVWKRSGCIWESPRA